MFLYFQFCPNPLRSFYTGRGGEIWFYKLWRRYITYIQSNSLPLWLKRHGGWRERECVCCKTISYQDNISNSIYDSQESTPTRTRNIPYPALTPEPKLKIRILRMQRIFSVQYLLVCCVCLLFEDDDWSEPHTLIWCYSVCFLLGWVLQLSPLADHVARTSRGARRERSGQWAAFIGVKSDYCWWCTLSFPGWCITPAHSVTLSARDPAQDTGHTPTTYTVQWATQARSQYKVSTIICKLNWHIAFVWNMEYSLTICIITVSTAFHSFKF